MSKVSILTPVYGVEKYIERCARSLFEQTLDDVEYIFVNDCSPDNSINILQQILEEYPHRKTQVRIIQHEQNRGLMAARNTAILHASGEYIIHCDSDDWMDFDLCEKLYSSIHDTQADMAYCAIVREYPNGNREKTSVVPYETAEELLVSEMHSPTFNTLCNKMFRSNIAKDTDLMVPDRISMCEDMLRVAQMLKKCSRITCCTLTYYHYRANEKSITATWKKEYFDQCFDVLDILQKKFPEQQYQRRLQLFATQIMLYALDCRNMTNEEYASLTELLYNMNWNPRELSWPLKIIFHISRKSYSSACCIYPLYKNMKKICKR